MNKTTYKILSLDGGGAKGIFSLGVLHEIEAKLGQPLSDHFDYFYGCSTGAIIAASLAQGKSVETIRNLYLSWIPKIMRCYSSAGRSAVLKRSLEDEFGEDTFESLKKPLAIVASSLDEKQVKIFKSDIGISLGRKKSFRPGFGFPLREALMASCAAFPFFQKVRLVKLEDTSDFRLMDGGFSANNPTLFALIDVIKGMELPIEQLRILSIGTGRFPVQESHWKIMTLMRYALSSEFISNLLDISANTTELITRYFLNESQLLRINKTYNDGEIATSILESNVIKLRKIYDFGKSAFGDFEREFDKMFLGS